MSKRGRKWEKREQIKKEWMDLYMEGNEAGSKRERRRGRQKKKNRQTTEYKKMEQNEIEKNIINPD